MTLRLPVRGGLSWSPQGIVTMMVTAVLQRDNCSHSMEGTAQL